MTTITIQAELEPTELARMVDDALGSDYDKLAEFIMLLDELVCDYDFTLQLRDELQKVIDRELAAGASAT